jgi:hypothetical protein
VPPGQVGVENQGTTAWRHNFSNETQQGATNTMTALFTRIHEIAVELDTDDVDTVTAAVLEGCPAKWAELLHPAVRQYVRCNVRNGQRTIERRDPSDGDDDAPPVIHGGRRDLLATTFACGSDLDFVRVTWGEATEAHHRSRIGMLFELVDGIQTTVERHQRAVHLIRKHHVDQLDGIADRDYVVAVIRGDLSDLPEAA